MKVRASVKKMCKDCFLVIRGRRTKKVRMIRCKVSPKHNQRQG